jgi:glycosyltransferase involved in cell wall biosynthesis
MSHYENKKCMLKYGASNYLGALRKRFLSGLYTKERFALLAAEAYCLINKPIRALTLLNCAGSIAGMSTSEAGKDVHDELPGIADFRKGELLDVQSKYRAGKYAQRGCSMNMIVRNEGDSIAAALDSADVLMDEIVVCDTGSTDNTREIAMLYGATILSIPWQNDFSAARNEAIKASTRTWIFWMDADDRLEKDSWADLACVINWAPSQAAAFRIINEQNGVAAAPFLQVRLFPRLNGLLFERRVHEQIMFSARRCNVPFAKYPNIKILHTGYNDPVAQKRKAFRNAALIELELKDHPGDAALLLNDGDCKMALGRIDQALEAYKRIALNAALATEHPDVFVQAHFNIGCIYHKKKDVTLAKRWLANCIRFDPTRIEAYFMLGRIFEDENNLQNALECYLQASRIEPPLRLTATNNGRIRMESIYRVARIMLAGERSKEAEELLRAAIAAFPSVVEYHALLGRAMLRQQKLKEAAQSFMQSLSLSTTNNREALSGMADIYNKLNDPVKEKMFLEMAGKG